jgi:1-deoxy-D-xylulose-5-phosphate synthase
VFGHWLCDMAANEEKNNQHTLVAITPAMSEGSGMVEFSQQFPKRYFDVAIAEQHALTLAAGMACDGLKPVVAIYSTFLQRAYDQLIHDIALQNLDVTFGIDRAGLVGEDGATHAGSFDLSFLRCIPNMLVAAPSDENETRQLLFTAFNYPGPAAVRYPRGIGVGATIETTMTALPIGKGVMKRSATNTHSKVAILSFGSLLPAALQAAENLNASVADMRFVKPLDEQLIIELANSHNLLVTLEENTIYGGAGSAVNELLNQLGITLPVLNLGLPDKFIDHGKHKDLLSACGLDAAGIQRSIEQRLQQMSLPLRA